MLYYSCLMGPRKAWRHEKTTRAFFISFLDGERRRKSIYMFEIQHVFEKIVGEIAKSPYRSFRTYIT